MQDLPAETLTVHLRSPEVLDQSVTYRGQPFQNFLARWLREIQSDAELASITLVEEGATIPWTQSRHSPRTLFQLLDAGWLDRATGYIGMLVGLDLDNLSAEGGQEEARIGTDGHLCEIQNADSIQCATEHSLASIQSVAIKSRPFHEGSEAPPGNSPARQRRWLRYARR